MKLECIMQLIWMFVGWISKILGVHCESFMDAMYIDKSGKVLGNDIWNGGQTGERIKNGTETD